MLLTAMTTRSYGPDTTGVTGVTGRRPAGRRTQHLRRQGDMLKDTQRHKPWLRLIALLFGLVLIAAACGGDDDAGGGGDDGDTDEATDGDRRRRAGAQPRRGRRARVRPARPTWPPSPPARRRSPPTR